MAKTKSIRQKLAEAKKLGMTPIQYSKYLKKTKKAKNNRGKTESAMTANNIPLLMSSQVVKKAKPKNVIKKSISKMMQDPLKKRVSSEGEKRIQAAANPKKPKKPKSNLSPSEYLIQQADIQDIMRNDVNIKLNRDAKPIPKKKKKVVAKETKDTLQDFTDEDDTPDDYKPPKKLKKYEGGIDYYDTPFGRIKSDSSDEAFNFDIEGHDAKHGGKVKRRMGGVIKKGFGKATRGY